MPWNASSGDVVVTVDGVPSNAVHLEIVPFEEGAPEDTMFAPGEIVVLMAEGADIGPILAAEGEPPDAAELAFDSDQPLFANWYTVAVAAGQEITKCRDYAKHPEVLTVTLNLRGEADDPSATPITETPQPTTQTPGSLPLGGATPAAQGQSHFGILFAIGGITILLALVCVGAAALKVRSPWTA